MLGDPLPFETKGGGKELQFEFMEGLEKDGAEGCLSGILEIKIPLSATPCRNLGATLFALK